MNTDLVITATQIRMTFTFEHPQWTLIELKIDSIAGEGFMGRFGDLRRTVEDIGYSRSAADSCLECARNQALVLMRRSVEEVRFLRVPTAITLSVEDENGGLNVKSNIDVSQDFKRAFDATVGLARRQQAHRHATRQVLGSETRMAPGTLARAERSNRARSRNKGQAA